MSFPANRTWSPHPNLKTDPPKGKVRIGMVGCGRISKNHFEAIRHHAANCELVAVCDTHSENLRQAETAHKVPGFARLEDMLKAGNLDLVVLCTPSGLHVEQGILASRYGVHVLTEKPMATTWESGLRLVRACDEGGVRLFVVKQNRLNATLQFLKKAVDENRFGALHMLTSNVFWTRPQDYYDQALWRGSWEFDGGAFMNQASHYVDLLGWLGGPVEKVHAFLATRGRAIETEDSGVVSFKYRSGALGSMNVTMLTYPQNLEGSITILGEKGTARIGGMALNKVLEWKFAEPSPDDEAVQKSSYETASVYGFGHQNYYQNVLEVLKGQAQPITDGRQGLKSLELLIAIYRSAIEGKEIGLPLLHSPG